MATVTLLSHTTILNEHPRSFSGAKKWNTATIQHSDEGTVSQPFPLWTQSAAVDRRQTAVNFWFKITAVIWFKSDLYYKIKPLIVLMFELQQEMYAVRFVWNYNQISKNLNIWRWRTSLSTDNTDNSSNIETTDMRK